MTGKLFWLQTRVRVCNFVRVIAIKLQLTAVVHVLHIDLTFDKTFDKNFSKFKHPNNKTSFNHSYILTSTQIK